MDKMDGWTSVLEQRSKIFNVDDHILESTISGKKNIATKFTQFNWGSSVLVLQ